MKAAYLTVIGLAAAHGSTHDGNQSSVSTLLPFGCDSEHSGYWCSLDKSRHWGANSPYFTVRNKINHHVSLGCEVHFVQVLSRHGARYPTKQKAEFYKKTIDKIRTQAQHFPLNYHFLKHYEFKLGATDLTAFGARQMYYSGRKLYNHYSHLAKRTTPFWRTSSRNRIVESAKDFTQGFHEAKSLLHHDPSYPHPMVIIQEEQGSNNTLAHSTCRAFEGGPKYGKMESQRFADQFIPSIKERINCDLGLSLDNQEVIALMDMCPYSTVGGKYGELSRFCLLFTSPEWRSYGHYQSLIKYYQYGPGNPLGPSQGVGWTNELIARLTNSPVRDDTSTNHTMTGSNATFPLGRTMYGDFTHDNVMVSIMYAMGLYDQTKPDLNNNNPDNFSADTAVPFAARMYVEKMRCPVKHAGSVPSCTTGCAHGPEMVRVLVNDRVVPLRNCNADRHGRCRLDRFVESLTFARSGGRWQQCGNSNSTNVKRQSLRPMVRVRPPGTRLEV